MANCRESLSEANELQLLNLAALCCRQVLPILQVDRYYGANYQYLEYMIKGRSKQPKRTPYDFQDIDSISYSTFSQDQLHDYSVLEIDEEGFYENEIPVKGGLFDLRLGISGPGQKCETCGESYECPGHIGHIKLNQPILHYGFLKQIAKVLRCICHHCMRLKRCKKPEDKQKMKDIRRVADPQKRLNLMSKLLENVRKCQSLGNDEDLFDKYYKPCQYYNHKKVIVKNYSLGYENQGKTYTTISRKQIKRLLQGISLHDSECQAMGFTRSRPVDLMIQSLVVPPPQTRPYVLINYQAKCEDDLSVAYSKIIRLNKQINIKNATSTDKQQAISQIQRIAGSIMFKLRAIKKKVGSKKDISNKVKSLSERWKGKEGRFRQNLLGKRVDFSARTVISPDPNLDLNQIGIPEKLAKNLTYPQKVTLLNYDHIIDLCLCKKVKVLINSPERSLRNEQTAINVQKIEAYTREEMKKYVSYGMIAQRVLEDGDYVLLNRQPTLHRMSMMAHKVRILPYNTFRINLSVCMPYNADFDGDQMNVHVPQSYESLSQLKNISAVQNQIVGPKNGTTTMGFSQDSLLGACMITARDTFLTLQDIMNLLMWTGGEQMEAEELFGQLPMPAIVKPQCLWTGKQVISLIIPKQIQIKAMKAKSKQEGYSNLDDKNLIIRKGQIVSGQLQKQFIGASSSLNNIIHFIWMEKGSKHAQNFINNLQKIVYNWLISIGFSIGLADIVPDKALQKIKQGEQKELQKLYFDVFNQYRNKKEINDKHLHQQGKKIMASFEFNVNLQLNSRLSKVQQIVKSLQNPIRNNICRIVDAKSKGSETNLAQILYSVGNQNINGMRCPLGFSKRALPHFRKDDNSSSARGYVLSSFYQGLNPTQFFFHSMGGRQGLSDTAIKTSHVGYIQRKIVKSLEDLIVKYDSSVRDSKNNILQNFYGEDGFSAQFIQKHRCHGAESSKNKFRQLYRWKEDQLKRIYRYSSQDINALKKQYSELHKNRKLFKQIFCINVDSPAYDYYCPIAIERIINQIKLKSKHTQNKQASKSNQKVDPLQIYLTVEKLLQQCVLPPQKYLQQLRKLKNESKQKNKSKKAKNAKQQYDSFSDQFERDDLEMQKIIHKYYNKSIKVSQKEDFEIFKLHLRFSLASKLLNKVHGLSRQNFNELIKSVRQKFFKSLVPAGEAVGCIASQSIGEPTTQMTLNTFHLAGISDRNVTLGLPRLQQLLNCSSTKSTDALLTIYPKKPVLYSERNTPQNQIYLLDLLMFDIPEKRIKDFICAVHYCYNPQRLKQKQKHLVGLADGKNRTPYTLQLIFNYHKIGSKKVWQSIYEKVEKKSKQNFQVDDIIDFNDLCSIGENPKIVLRYIHKAGQDTMEEKIQKMKEAKSQGMNKKLSHLQNIIKDAAICGIPGIKSVKIAKKTLHISEESKQKEYVIFEAMGSSIKDCLSNPKINAIKTSSNSIQQTSIVLGIQAARQCLINQLKQVLKPYGIVINYRHLSVLADWMCSRGTLTQVNRYGLHKIKSVSTLTKASYEKSTDTLLNAAVFSIKDSLKDTSQRIIFGQQPQCGTNLCKLMVDPQRVGRFTYRLEQQNIKEANFSENAYCRTPKHEMSMTNDNSMFDAWRSQLNNSFHSVVSNNNKSPSLIAQTPMLSFSPNYSPNINAIRNISPKYTAEYRKYEGGTTDYSLKAISPNYRMLNSPTYNLNTFNKMSSPSINKLESVGEVNKKEQELEDYEYSQTGREDDQF